MYAARSRRLPIFRRCTLLVIGKSGTRAVIPWLPPLELLLHNGIRNSICFVPALQVPAHKLPNLSACCLAILCVVSSTSNESDLGRSAASLSHPRARHWAVGQTDKPASQQQPPRNPAKRAAASQLRQLHHHQPRALQCRGILSPPWGCHGTTTALSPLDSGSAVHHAGVGVVALPRSAGGSYYSR